MSKTELIKTIKNEFKKLPDTATESIVLLPPEVASLLEDFNNWYDTRVIVDGDQHSAAYWILSSEGL
jgi:hypothetical protein